MSKNPKMLRTSYMEAPLGVRHIAMVAEWEEEEECRVLPWKLQEGQSVLPRDLNGKPLKITHAFDRRGEEGGEGRR